MQYSLICEWKVGFIIKGAVYPKLDADSNDQICICIREHSNTNPNSSENTEAIRFHPY